MDVTATSSLGGLDHVGGLDIGNGLQLVNHSGLDDDEVINSTGMRELARKLSGWVDNARAQSTRHNLFDRGTYVPPDNPYSEMMAARTAVETDDIVGGVAEVTEGFAFQGQKWEGPSEEEADVFNQISRDLNLDDIIRQMWRETFTYSKYVIASVWDYRTYKVRGRTENGNKRKKEYTVYCPVQLAVLDATKVVPVGHTPIGTQGLAWSSTNQEIEHWIRSKQGKVYDPLMEQFFIGTFKPAPSEDAELARMGVDTNNLLLMNPGMVWEHTTTKPGYKRFPDIRMKSLFSLLDLKRQLINADRAMLIGAANYILVVKKGNDERPAKAPEMENLKDNFKFVAKLPVIISDHRLEVEIVAPKIDFTLKQDRYDLIDLRILMRLLGTLSPGARGQRNETNVTISRAVARNMENRRHMIRRDLEQRLARAVYEHPRNEGVFDEGEEPNLVFVPRNISLQIDAAFVQAIMQLRQSKELSRETILEHFGFDQATEAQRREMEDLLYDEIFGTIVPHGSPEQDGTPGQTGRQGGRPVGGGKQKQTTPKDQTENGNPSTSEGNS